MQWNIETLTTHLLVFSSEEKERQLPQQLTSLEGNGHCLLPVSSVVEMVTHPQLAGPLLVADLRLLVPALHPHPPQQLAGRCMGVQRIPRLRIPCVSCSFIYIIPATRYSIFLFHHLDNCYTTFCWLLVWLGFLFCRGESHSVICGMWECGIAVVVLIGV